MKAYLIITAIIFGFTTLNGIANSKDAGDTVICALMTALCAWGVYLATTL